MSIELQITPPLNRGQSVEIPLKVAGDADAYMLAVTATGGSSSSSLDGPSPTVTFARGNYSTGPDSLTLVVTPPRNDDDLVFDVVNVEIDENNLPPGFMLGNKPSWKVEIVDDQLHEISFAPGRREVYRSSGGRVSLSLNVHPPLPPNEGLSWVWEYDSFGSLRMWEDSTCGEGCVKHMINVREVTTSEHAEVSWQDLTTNSYVPFRIPVRQNSELPTETTTLSLQTVPSGFKVGKHRSFTLFIHDDD